jgi:hypothetical protein
MLTTRITWNTYSDGVLVSPGANRWRTAHRVKGVGAWPIYHRHVSNEVFVPPFRFSGRFLVRERLNSVWIESEQREPTWDWGLCFFPLHVNNDNNLVARFWNRAQRLTLSQEHNHKYTNVGKFINVPNPQLDVWHSFVFDVKSYTQYDLMLNNQQIGGWLFPEISDILRVPVNVGFRCDFFDVEFDNIQVTEVRSPRMYEPVNPRRVLDLRPKRPNPGSVVTVRTNAPPGSTATHVNITVVDSVGGGYVTAWSQGVMPESSVLNTFAAGQTVANAVNVPLTSTGEFKLFTSAGDLMIVDVMGFFK